MCCSQFLLMMAECPFPFNVQLFQEMKYKFPNIPVEVIQNCIMKYPRDREACIQLLNKTNMHSLGASAMTHLANNHHYSINVHRKLPVTNGSSPYLENPFFSSPGHYLNLKKPIEAKTEMDRPSISGFPSLPQYSSAGQMAPYSCNIYSVSAVPSEHKPFNVAYSTNAHGGQSQTSQNLAQAAFSSNRPNGWKCASSAQLPCATTSKSKRQITGEATNPLSLSSRENGSHHITTLKINPLPPHAYNPSSSICRNVTSSGRHMTSVNFQLQPPSSEPQVPIEITTTPLSCGPSHKENSSFNSHLQISISSMGATLTAVRTNKKPPAGCSEQQLTVQRSMPSTLIVSKSKPNCPREHENSNMQHVSQHYDATLQEHSETANFVNVLNLPQLQESQQNKTFQHFTSFHSPVLDGHSVHTASSGQLAYTQALLLQQRTRLNFIQTILSQEREILARIRAEVNSMERDLLQRRLDLTAVSNMTDMQNLREENRQLRVECHCLSMEVDLSLRGQVPLGETDEDFYRNIFTGPIGPIPPAPPSQGEELDSGDGLTCETEENRLWKCSECTFANHPALNKCEMCEMERPSDSGHTETGPTYHSQYHRIINTPQLRHAASPERSIRTWPRRGIGRVQIRVMQNRSTVPSKGLDIHLSHRYPRR